LFVVYVVDDGMASRRKKEGRERGTDRVGIYITTWYQ